jgi:putative NADPH-quinone reductase
VDKIKNVLVLNGNTKTESLSGSICKAIVEVHTAKGREVRYMHIKDMAFDPISWEGYNVVQPLEPVLEEFRQAVLDCQLLVIVFPTWWGGMPVKLKGLFDRSFISGYAYKYRDKGPLWDKLLKGRAAYIVTTTDAPWWWSLLSYRNGNIHQLRGPILAFCGFAPIRTRLIDKVRFRNRDDIAKKAEKIANDSLKF